MKNSVRKTTVLALLAFGLSACQLLQSPSGPSGPSTPETSVTVPAGTFTYLRESGYIAPWMTLDNGANLMRFKWEVQRLETTIFCRDSQAEPDNFTWDSDAKIGTCNQALNLPVNWPIEVTTGDPAKCVLNCERCCLRGRSHFLGGALLGDVVDKTDGEQVVRFSLTADGRLQ